MGPKNQKEEVRKALQLIESGEQLALVRRTVLAEHQELKRAKGKHAMLAAQVAQASAPGSQYAPDPQALAARVRSGNL
eukprot:6290626-Alexandrium_andersonii.AAC.1